MDLPPSAFGWMAITRCHRRACRKCGITIITVLHDLRGRERLIYHCSPQCAAIDGMFPPCAGGMHGPPRARVARR